MKDFETINKNLFKGCRVMSIGRLKTKQIWLKRLIKYCGGEWYYDFCDEVNLIISDFKHKECKKYKQAIDNNITIVTLDYIHHCLDKNEQLSNFEMKRYYLHSPTNDYYSDNEDWIGLSMPINIYSYDENIENNNSESYDDWFGVKYIS